MPSNQKVSIILPTYNGSKFIKESVESCLGQSYRNIELVIVDDCSTDETEEILDSFTDERIRRIKHKKNMGLPSALNSGFSICTGDYLTWTSDDNLYMENAVEVMLNHLTSSGSNFVYCDYWRFSRRDFTDRKLVRPPDDLRLNRGNEVGACFLYSREVLLTVGEYDKHSAYAEDYDYWVRASEHFQLIHLSEPLYLYREHRRSISVTSAMEVPIASVLIRLRHGLIDEKTASEIMIDHIASRMIGGKSLNIHLCRLLFSIKFQILFSRFITSTYSIEQAQDELIKISRPIRVSMFLPTLFHLAKYPT